MRSLLVSLRESDAALLPILAKRWGVDTSNMNTIDATAALNAAMLEAPRAERMWGSLTDEQRGALQTLIGARGKMALVLAERVLGKIRKMGTGAIQREKPDENPASIGEALFYRGLIYEGFEQVPAGARPVVFVPDDLMAVLPAHKTSYDSFEPSPSVPGPSAVPGTAPVPGGAAAAAYMDDDGPTIDALDADTLDTITPADTSIVDDMTTLLAYIQLNHPMLKSHDETLHLGDSDRAALASHLLYGDDMRLSFMLEIAISADLVEVSAGQASVRRAEARRWLEEKRAAQVKRLADAWRVSPIYRDLWHVPGLRPEPTGWPYDPIVARGAVMLFLRDYVPRQSWWSMDELITTIKETEPDFQRPGGDYDSWYIRNEQGDYLTGFESWDAVEGALLEFYLLGPLHWLGMMDLAEDAARLTAYGRAFVTGEMWPSPPDTEEKVTVQPDGTLIATRRVPRIDRFQMARFTSWYSPATLDGAPYTYRLNAQGIQQAEAQGITTGHIHAFVTRMLDGAALPAPIAHLLETWQAGPTSSVTLERVLILRTTAIETLDFIMDKPALRRYMGARLGEMAAIVRADQWEALRDALGEHGIEVDVLG